MTLRFRRSPFSSKSLWNLPLADDYPLADTSLDWSARLYRQTQYFQGASPISGPWTTGFTTQIQTTSFTFPIYVLPENHPRQRVTWIRTTGTVPAVGEEEGLQTYWENVPVPDPSLCQPGTNRASSASGQIGSDGTDESCIFICGNEAWEFYRFRHKNDLTGSTATNATAAGVTGWTAVYGAYIRNIYAHIGVFRRWGVPASGFSALGGLVLAEDSEKETIDHALRIAIANTGEGASTEEHINPAKRGDTHAFDLNGTTEAIEGDKISHGARFRLPYDFDVEGWVDDHKNESGVSEQGLRALCLAGRDHGFVVSDSASGVVQFLAEDARSFGTPYSPWSTRPTGLGTLNRQTVGQVPWAHLQQLATINPLDQKVPISLGGERKLMRYR